MSYSYHKNDLLLNPEKYEMSPYHGIPFLTSYIESRNLILQNIPRTVEIHDLKSLFSPQTNILTQHTEQFFTFDLFLELLFQILNNNIDHNVTSKVDIFLKKFEIKKKFFTSYDYDFEATTNNSSQIKNYVIFSIICHLYYQKTLNLKYLNTLLKLNDLIYSQIQKCDDTEKALFKLCIKNELSSINHICKDKGLKFD